MKVLGMREQLRDVAERWKRQYPNSRADEYKKLKSLDIDSANDFDVSRIIGNTSWVCQQACDECRNTSWEIVELGEPPDYESRTANLCRPCLEKALDKLAGKS